MEVSGICMYVGVVTYILIIYVCVKLGVSV